MRGSLTAKLRIGTVLTLFMALAACGKGTGGLIQNSEAKSSTGWTVKVIEASQPGTVKVKTRSIYGGTEPEKVEAPPANEKWILLSAELTPPASGASLAAAQIKLVDGTANYPALAMAGAPDKGDPALHYFKDSAGLGQISASGDLAWMITKNLNTGVTEITFQKGGSQKVFFLFAVPSAANALTLQL